MKYRMLFPIFVLLACLRSYSQGELVLNNQSDNFLDPNNSSKITLTSNWATADLNSLKKQCENSFYCEALKFKDKPSSQVKFHIGKIVNKAEPFRYENKFTKDFYTGISISFELSKIFK